jgi:hypothetical protein
MPKQIHSWQNLFGACRAFFETGPKKPNQVKKNPVQFGVDMIFETIHQYGSETH